MAQVTISSAPTQLASGLLQLQSGVAMSTTLTSVTDQNNNASQLKLATNSTQVAGTLQITTNNTTYLDIEDGSGNNRFTVSRDPSSQVVTVDFASNPTGGTNLVGAIRTYTDGVSLSNVMSFRKDGNVGVGTSSPQYRLHIEEGGKTYSPSGVIIKAGSRFSTGGADYGSDCLSSIGGGALTLKAYYYTIINRVDTTNPQVLQVEGQTLIKGSGSTSATTSLLVQNSGGTYAMTIKDDLSTNLGGILNLVYNSSYISASGGANSSTTFIANTSVGWNGFAFGNSSLSYFAEIRTDRTNVYTPLFVTLVGNIGSASPPTPNASAILQADSTTQGYLGPRMTDAQVRAIVSPAIGLEVFNTTLDCPVFYSSTGWRKVSHSVM